MVDIPDGAAVDPAPVAIPDPDLHHLCARCGRWFEHDDVVTVAAPERFAALGPIGTALSFARTASGVDRATVQHCLGCSRRRFRGTRRAALLWTALIILVVAVLVADALGLLPANPSR